MATAAITNSFKNNVVTYFTSTSSSSLAKITRLCWGSGGHTGTTAKPVDGARTALFSQTGSKALESIRGDGNYIVCTAKLSASEAGRTISEVGLLDSSGRLVAIKTFPPKTVESGETYTVQLRLNIV